MSDSQNEPSIEPTSMSISNPNPNSVPSNQPPAANLVNNNTWELTRFGVSRSGRKVLPPSTGGGSTSQHRCGKKAPRAPRDGRIVHKPLVEESSDYLDYVIDHAFDDFDPSND